VFKGREPSRGAEVNRSERTHNPFTRSSTGGRTLSALQLPLFTVYPPSGYGVLTTTGRKSGKKRRRCLRVIRRGDKVYVAAMKGGETTGWVKNARANPSLTVRLRGGTFPGLARDLTEAEREEGSEAYCETVTPFDYMTYMMWRKGVPTPSRIRALFRGWFRDGTPLIIALGERHRGGGAQTTKWVPQETANPRPGTRR
jgi:deazaflavin-dependent oxidoreductase (nitroreductase family)